jgi:hypothetical protein
LGQGRNFKRALINWASQNGLFIATSDSMGNTRDGICTLASSHDVIDTRQWTRRETFTSVTEQDCVPLWMMTWHTCRHCQEPLAFTTPHDDWSNDTTQHSWHTHFLISFTPPNSARRDSLLLCACTSPTKLNGRIIPNLDFLSSVGLSLCLIKHDPMMTCQEEYAQLQVWSNLRLGHYSHCREKQCNAYCRGWYSTFRRYCINYRSCSFKCKTINWRCLNDG